MSASGPRSRALRWLAVPALLAALVAAGWSFSFPGCLSVDEVTYLLSARSLAGGSGVEVWNGYEEFPSPELAPGWLKVVDGRLVSQYPDFFLFLALPAYRALGFRGLFLVNVLAFAGVLALTWSLAARFYDRLVAGLAVGLLVASSFAFEYAPAAWPHMVSALVTLAALSLLSAAAEASRRSLALSAAAGLVGGVGIGVRLDVAFSLAAMVGVLLLLRPVRWREAIAVALGAAAPLLALAALNASKFGVFSPFDYGPDYYGPGTDSGWSRGELLQLVALLALASAVAVVLARGSTSRPLTRRIATAALALLLVVAALSPVARRAAVALAQGSWELLVDLRARPLDRIAPALSRGPDGGFVYFGSLKKALLQSCPWLFLAALPVVAAARREVPRRPVLFLAAAPAALIGLYSFFAWDGGLALNQRYFVPALPMLAILAATGLRSLLARTGARAPELLLAGALPLAIWIGLVESGRFDYPRQSLLLLDLPLLVAGALLGALTAVELSTRLGVRHRAWARGAAWLAAVAVAWAALSAWAYDLPRTLAYRRFHANLGAQATRTAGPETIIFSQPAELAASALDGPARIRLANPGKDENRTFEALARFHAERGRTVLLAVYRPRLERMIATGALSSWRLERVATIEVAEVVRLIPSDAGAPAPQPP